MVKGDIVPALITKYGDLLAVPWCSIFKCYFQDKGLATSLEAGIRYCNPKEDATGGGK